MCPQSNDFNRMFRLITETLIIKFEEFLERWDIWDVHYLITQVD